MRRPALSLGRGSDRHRSLPLLDLSAGQRRVGGDLVDPAAQWFSMAQGQAADVCGTDHVQPVFCGDCGAHLALSTVHSPQTIDVTVATLDHPENVRATRHIWTSSRLPWLHLDEQLPGEAEERL